MLLPVIMAGGTGSRLWPMSRELYPKQFLRLHSENSMLQETVLRLESLEVREPVVICNEEHRFLVAEQLRQIKKLSNNIILEPIGRNTAPAIALAALNAIKDGDDPVMLVLAADHVIHDVEIFHAAVEKAIPFANANSLVTFGIVPTGPETGYGYIQRGDSIGNLDEGYKVKCFVEKPNLPTAESYIASGEYYWNSGMFMFRAKKYLEELEKFRPDIYEACKKSLCELPDGMDFITVDKESR
jgi:mannose-1-phosphate guanylyltransferase